jgi:hypothetical protein
MSVCPKQMLKIPVDDEASQMEKLLEKTAQLPGSPFTSDQTDLDLD